MYRKKQGPYFDQTTRPRQVPPGTCLPGIGLDDKHCYSLTFEILCEVIQGDIISPILFIISLDQLVQQFDSAEDTGVRVDSTKLLSIGVLGYVADAALIIYTVDKMTQRLSTFTDADIQHANIHVKLAKTFTQIVGKQDQVTPVTRDKIKAMEGKLKFPCDFKDTGYTTRFNSEAAIQSHRSSCTFNYGTTSEAFEIETIQSVYDKAARKLFLVKWSVYEETSWEPEHLLLRDGYK